MVPIANRPVMEYAIENLRRHGIKNVILNLHSHPDLIKNHFGDGSRWGMEIEYSHEPNLMGTAGGVKKASYFFGSQTFLVTSGDGLSDINVADLIAFHHKNKSVGTMALCRMDTKFEYGVTLTQPNGRIKKFVEKPHWGDVFSDQVNTGIYVFEPSVLKAMPANRIIDFGHEVWPQLLAKKKPIFGRLSKGYWCDVGNFTEYQRAQRDFLDRKVDFKLPGKEIRRGIWAEENVEIAKGAKITGPCVLGRNVRIASGAQIGPYAVLGHDCTVGEGSSIKYTTLWNKAKVGRNVYLEASVLGQDVHVGDKTHLYGGILLSRVWK